MTEDSQQNNVEQNAGGSAPGSPPGIRPFWKFPKTPPSHAYTTDHGNGRYTIYINGPDEEPEDDRTECHIERKGPSDTSWEPIASGTTYSPFDGNPYPDPDLEEHGTYLYRCSAKYTNSAYNGSSITIPVTLP